MERLGSCAAEMGWLKGVELMVTIPWNGSALKRRIWRGEGSRCGGISVGPMLYLWIWMKFPWGIVEYLAHENGIEHVVRITP